MTTQDPMTPQERALRDRLHAGIVPPRTPERLRLAVADMGEREMASARSRRARWGRSGFATLRSLRAGAAVVAVVVVAVVVTVAVVTVSGRPSVATAPHPSLPPVTGSPLPSPVAHPTRVDAGAWLDASHAWTLDGVNAIRMTSDGGQTWSAPRPLPVAPDLGADFVDALHGQVLHTGITPAGPSIDIETTSNGGNTWTDHSVGVLIGPLSYTNLRASAHFADARHGVVLVAASTVAGSVVTDDRCVGWSTDDGGTTWTSLASVPCAERVIWSGATIGLAQSSALNGTGALLTRDGGRTWQTGTIPGVAADQELGISVVTSAGSASVRMAGTVLSRSGVTEGAVPLIVFETDDGGSTWGEAYRSTDLAGSDVQSVYALDGNHWLAVIQVTTAGLQSKLAETVDGGRSWTMLGSTGQIMGFEASWVDRLHGVLHGVDVSACALPNSTCGGRPTLFLTNDGGQTWHALPF